MYQQQVPVAARASPGCVQTVEGRIENRVEGRVETRVETREPNERVPSNLI